MNKKGQLSLVAFMLAIVIVILALAFIPGVTQMTNNAMNETSQIGGMNCTKTTDDFVKAGCWTADLTQVLFIGGLLALAGVIISAKVIFG